MKLCWVTLHVRDLSVSLKFYRDLLGLKISNQMKIKEGLEIVFMSGDGEARIELICDKNVIVEKKDHSFSVGLDVENLDELVKRAKSSGGVNVVGPIKPNPHVRFYMLSDPDGYTIQLVETK